MYALHADYLREKLHKTLTDACLVLLSPAPIPEVSPNNPLHRAIVSLSQNKSLNTSLLTAARFAISDCFVWPCMLAVLLPPPRHWRQQPSLIPANRHLHTDTCMCAAAMEAEATPFIQSLNLQEDKPRVVPGPAPCITYSGQLGDLTVHVAWNGKCDKHQVDYVGTVPASLTAYLATQAFQPHLVISAGTAGGFHSRVSWPGRFVTVWIPLMTAVIVVKVCL